MGRQLYNVGDELLIGLIGTEDVTLEVVDISSREAKGGTVFTYHMVKQTEVPELNQAIADEEAIAIQNAKAEEVAAAERGKLTPTDPEAAKIDESKIPEAAREGDESVSE